MTTNNLSHLCPHLQLDRPLEVVELDGYEYLGGSRVLISLKTGAGDLVAYTMSTAMFVQSLNLGTECMHANLADVLTDISVFGAA